MYPQVVGNPPGVVSPLSFGKLDARWERRWQGKIEGNDINALFNLLSMGLPQFGDSPRNRLFVLSVAARQSERRVSKTTLKNTFPLLSKLTEETSQALLSR